MSNRKHGGKAAILREAFAEVRADYTGELMSLDFFAKVSRLYTRKVNQSAKVRKMRAK